MGLPSLIVIATRSDRLALWCIALAFYHRCTPHLCLTEFRFLELIAELDFTTQEVVLSPRAPYSSAIRRRYGSIGMAPHAQGSPVHKALID
jgi:hypothetical protein